MGVQLESIEALVGKIEQEYVDTKGETRKIFQEDAALAILLLDDQVFLNDHWWEKSWPEDAKRRTSLNLNCNDVFAWGCADAETIDFKDIEPIYQFWKKDPVWGTAVWCMIRRNQMPQRPVEKKIRDAGIWNLDDLSLGANTMDAAVKYQLALFAHQHPPAEALTHQPPDHDPTDKPGSE